MAGFSAGPGRGSRTGHMDIGTTRERPFRRRLSNAAVLASVFLFTMTGLSGWSYWSEWQREISKTQQLCRALSTAAAEQIGGSLRTIDLLIQHVGHFMQANGGLDPQVIAASLDIQSRSFPEIAALIVTDEAGAARSVSDGHTDWDFSRSDFFTLQQQMFRDNPVVVDGPLRDKKTGEWQVVLSRPLVSEGNFRGVVAAVLKPSFFADPLKSSGIGDNATVMLLNVNRVVFGRFPEGDSWIGQAVSQEMLDASSGQITAYRTVQNYPLMVVASIPVKHVQESWWSNAALGIGVNSAIGIVMIYLAVLFDRHERQKRRAAEQLRQLNQELEQRVLERTRSLTTEIAERSRAEAESVKLKEAYRELFDGAIEGILIHRRFKPLLANQSCAQLFGYEKVADLLALPSVLSLVSAEARPRLVDATERSLATRTPATIEFEAIRPDRETVWCLNSIRPVDWGGEAAIQAAFVNITASKSWQFAMHEAKEAAERASDLKSRFLAVASHDLRQPAQALAFYANVLEKRVRSTEFEEIVRHIRESSDSLGALLDSLLDISRLEAGSIRPDLQNVALAPIFERLWAMFCPAAEAAGISLSAVPSDRHVFTDPTLLERVLQNLIANAIRYTPSGGKVLLGVRRRGERIIIQVFDTGRGIPQEMLPRVFDEFFRLGGNFEGRRVGAGLGLGLSIVRRLCDLLGHRLEARSRLGRGSVFSVEAFSAMPSGPAEAEPVFGSVPGWPESCLILIIENDPQLRASLQCQLQDWGVRALVAGSGDESLDVVRREGRPDLVLADYRLDDGEVGTGVAALLEAALGRRLRLVLLTGETALCSESDPRLADCRIVHKPIGPEELRQVLLEELGKSPLPEKELVTS
jgi:PAS domain S-box-containing protein